MYLSELTPGNKGKVVKLLATGSKKRRLLDLGLIPGTTVHSIRKSPSGDPTAFLIRGSTLALRSEESNEVKIKLIKEEEV
ncbi:MAG: FeoA family protein [Halanaerobiales bacterium]